MTTDPTNPLTRARQAIADIIRAAHDDIETFAYVPDSTPNYPVAFTIVTDGEHLTTRRNRRRRTLEIVVLVGLSQTDRGASARLDDLLEGAANLATVLSADRTLGGTVTDSAVTSDRRLSFQQLAGFGAWGHQWDIDIELGDHHATT